MLYPTKLRIGNSIPSTKFSRGNTVSPGALSHNPQVPRLPPVNSCSTWCGKLVAQQLSLSDIAPINSLCFLCQDRLNRTRLHWSLLCATKPSLPEIPPLPCAHVMVGPLSQRSIHATEEISTWCANDCFSRDTPDDCAIACVRGTRCNAQATSKNGQI